MIGETIAKKGRVGSGVGGKSVEGGICGSQQGLGGAVDVVEEIDRTGRINRSGDGVSEGPDFKTGQLPDWAGQCCMSWTHVKPLSLRYFSNPVA